MKISSLEIGTKADIRLVLSTCSLRKTSTRPPRNFLSVTFTDGEEQISGNIWNYIVPNKLPEAGTIYDISATVGEYQGRKQLNIDTMEVSANQSKTDFSVCFCDDSAGKMYWDILCQYIGSISHETLHRIVATIYKTYEEPLKVATSACSVHHVGIYGNIAHTLEVCKIADAICGSTVMPVSHDLVIAGALLHDIGKAHVYEVDGPLINYTDTGVLFEHIAEGVDMLHSIRPQFDLDAGGCFELLTHIILSHHGKLEYGSPVTPCFLEAYIVSIADSASANINTLITANNKATTEGRARTEKIWALDNKEHILQSQVYAMLGGVCNA